MKATLKISMVLLFSLLCKTTIAQLDRQWVNEYTTADTAYMDVIGLYDAGGGDVIKASMVTKFVSPNSFNRLLLQKIAPSGIMIWEESYEHPQYEQFFLAGGGTDASGNLYFSGQVTIDQSTANWFVISFDDEGQQRWEQNIVDNSFASGGSHRCVVDANGNTYASGNVGGNGMSFGVIVKYDNAGSEQWVKYDEMNYNYGADMIIAGNGDLIAADGEYEITRLSPDGNIEWSTPDTTEWIYASPEITEAPDGSIYAITFHGFSYSLKKLDANGNFLWNNHEFPENLVFGDASVDVKADAQSNIYVTGINTTSQPGVQTTMFKFSPNGEEIWRQEFWQEVNDIYDILLLPSGNPVISASSWTSWPNFPVVLVLNGATGNIIDADSLELSSGQSVLLYNEAGLYMAATGNFSTLLAKYSSTVSVDEIEGEDNISVFPNPFGEIVNISSEMEKVSYEVLDISGKKIMSGNEGGSFSLPMYDLSPGTYILLMRGEEGQFAGRKIIKS